eukprot:TRINITY_DN30166_c0_g2_i1.p1 TRINITY_DN30166_c0_g2~~TRINITY_DN30166_c0_g2_i1.p1  ORF type:complete len:4212 (-),score=769.14 TRINITY_DN30166_c0_g2_i1:57-12692(-)
MHGGSPHGNLPMRHFASLTVLLALTPVGPVCSQQPQLPGTGFTNESLRQLQAKGDEALPILADEASRRHLATRLANNLAQGQPVTLSSTARFDSRDGRTTFMGDGYRATDGDTGTYFFGGRGCAETTAMPYPWLRVDMGREVPVADVRLFTRHDSEVPALGPLNIHLGNGMLTWRENLLCASKFFMTRSSSRLPAPAQCRASGRYLWVVLETDDNNVKPLSICEVEVTPKGPTGTLHVLQTAGGMWPLELSGLALSDDDRIRIVADTVICGLVGSSTMDSAVLELTAPMGKRSFGNAGQETWSDIQISNMGIYKVCWCGGVGVCSSDQDFGLHVATLIINGVIITVAGDGRKANRSSDVVDDVPGDKTPMREPYGLAIAENFAYWTEKTAHMIRYMIIETGRTYRLGGQFSPGFRGDRGPAIDAEFSTPMGLSLDPSSRFLYVADSGNSRVRRIDVSGAEKSQGRVANVAGNGNRGFSGDGGPAIEAQLNTPSDVAVDLNEMLWISDYGNNVIRVVSMKIPVRIPGTNEFQAGIILAAAGGGTSTAGGGKGDGGPGWLAQVRNPLGVTVSQTYLSLEEGSLPVAVYASEATGSQVRTMTLEYQSYFGIIKTLAGDGNLGSALKESSPLEAQNVQMNTPSGIAVEHGIVYVADSGNNRILMLPALEYVSMGCWRENIDSPWIPSIEGKPRPFGNDYLTGAPENRELAIMKCALATMQRGYKAFAVRQMGVCATSKDAHLYYQFEGSSTSCADGKGGARDNSVYKFAREGLMEQMQGIVYEFVGRKIAGKTGPDAHAPGFRGDLGTAWEARLSQPNGLAIHPSSKDIWIADTGNNRIRLIFGQIGPKKDHTETCINGLPCQVDIKGNGLQNGNKLAIMPYDQNCGQAPVTFQSGLEFNPVKEMSSSSYTMKSYPFGAASVLRVGKFRLCYCIMEAVVFGVVSPCTDAVYFIRDAGYVTIIGPDSRILDSEVMEVMPGEKFSLPLYGLGLSLWDRVRIVPSTQKCAQPGAEKFAPEVNSVAELSGQRHLGNETFSIWQNISMSSAGSFNVCWCKGYPGVGKEASCKTGQEFLLLTARLTVRGPLRYSENVAVGGTQDITVRGGALAGFSAGNRIRIIDSATERCGTDSAKGFSASVTNNLSTMPDGAPNKVSEDSITWSNVQLRSSRLLTVCWCGAKDGCVEGKDFLTASVDLLPLGPRTDPPQVVQVVANNTDFSLGLVGIGLNGNERITVVDDYVACGKPESKANSREVLSDQPSGGPSYRSSTLVRWDRVKLERNAMYRICYCYCQSGRSTDCCQDGSDFFTEVGAVFVGINSGAYEGRVLAKPAFQKEAMRQSYSRSMWGTVPQDKTRKVYLWVKTREKPAHAGTQGPIEIKIFQSIGKIEYFVDFTLTNLVAGETQKHEKDLLLDTPMTAHGIMVKTTSSDAWYCEWIEVEIFGGIKEAESLGKHRFSCEGWAVFPADRNARMLTEELRAPPLLPATLPPPLVGVWESRFFVPDPCGSCPMGYECLEEHATMPERLVREAELGLVYTERGVSNGELAALTMYKSRCSSVCGDGFAQPEEQCDDGNIRGLDGCSADCKVENAFECANFPDAPSSCYPRICLDHKLGSFPTFGQRELQKIEQIGSSCSTDGDMKLKAPPDMPRVCYQWDDVAGGPGPLCPADTTEGTLRNWVFETAQPANVGCRSFKMDYMGDGKQCVNFTRTWGPPLDRQSLIRSYDDCAHLCDLEQECMALAFFIDNDEGGKACRPDAPLCQAQCRMYDACDVSAISSSPADKFHVGKRVMKTKQELPVNRICSKVNPPLPATAYEDGGVVIVQFGSPVAALPGINLSQDFPCSDLLMPQSQVSVGGSSAACRWVIPSVLHILLGPQATLARRVAFDAQGWIKGDSAELLFDRSKLVPRGMAKDLFADMVGATPLSVVVRFEDPLENKNANMPLLPDVVLRGPPSLGGCGDYEVTADVSSMSSGRRWKSASWSCLETRPDPSLDPLIINQMYDYCAAVLQPYMDKKSWCGFKKDEYSAVVKPCEMRVIIPSSLWCGLSFLKLGVTLTSFEGYQASREWNTTIVPLSRIPTTGPVGPTTVYVKPQNLHGTPAPKLRLEVYTESDAKMVGKCTCNRTLPPNPDGSESRVLVAWFYGEVLFDIIPRQFEMTEVVNDENAAPNVMVLPLTGEIMKPNTHWRFVARVAYAVHNDVQASFVPFDVFVTGLEAPQAHLVGPTRVQGAECGFVLDARDSKIRYSLYSSAPAGGLRRLDEEGRQLQSDDSSTVGMQELEYRWEVNQLLEGVDDGFRAKVPSIGLEKYTLEEQKGGVLCVAQAQLKNGLYVFKVTVWDKAQPSLKSEAYWTTEVHDRELFDFVTGDLAYVDPAFSVLGPSGIVRHGESVRVTFKQVGFKDLLDGMCKAPSGKPGKGNLPGVVILLMRSVAGEPESYMRAIAELEMTYKDRTSPRFSCRPESAGEVGKEFFAEAPRSLLEPGFNYKYRFLSAQPSHEQQLTDYKDAELEAGKQAMEDDMRYLRTPLREFPSKKRNEGRISLTDSEVFSIHRGPVAGSLDLLSPAGRIGSAMKDLFVLQQVWATDNPPLEYAFYYAKVPIENIAEFKKELLNFSDDIYRDRRLSSLVPPGAMVPLSDWSLSPTLTTPLPEGLYVFEGRVRDAMGAEERKLAMAQCYPAYTEQVVTSRDRIIFLEDYIARAQKAILQVRAYNRGVISSVPVCSAVYSLPSLFDYDFRSMIEWNKSSFAPPPNLSQPIYGAPICSRETRAAVITYLQDLMSVLSDIVMSLDAEALGGNATSATRRLQAVTTLDEAYFGAEDGAGSNGTQSHVEAISGALAHLASNLAPLGEDELAVTLATLTANLLERIRSARGDIRNCGTAPAKVMKTMAYLLAMVRPIDKFRDGTLQINISMEVQARLSEEIVRGTGAMSDVLSTMAEHAGPPVSIKVAMPQQPFLNPVGGDFIVTIIKRMQFEVQSNGVKTRPDYQSMQRWVYPEMNIEPLGPSGFRGREWAGGEPQVNPAEIQCQEDGELFLKYVVVSSVAWPVNPFMYATGSLVGMSANVVMPYTVQFRSCGQPVTLKDQAGKVQMTFRLDPAVVRDRRWGYGDTVPYRVAWWEDIPGVSKEADRIRRWTTHGCKTEWNKNQEDLVTAICDRLPTSQGAVFVVELVPRPVYTMEGAPSRNRNVHNVMTYTMLIFLVRWAYLLLTAIRGDTNFWPSEKQLMKLTYLPHERKWRARIRRGRLPPQGPLSYNPMTGAFWIQTQSLMIDRIIWAFCSFQAMKGSELFMSVEVRELIKMRSGNRDVTYERFVESMNEKDNMEKIQFVKEQRSIAASQALAALPGVPGMMDRRAAWGSSGGTGPPAALADAEAFSRQVSGHRAASEAGSHMGGQLQQQPSMLRGIGHAMPGGEPPVMTAAQLRHGGDPEEQQDVEDAEIYAGNAPSVGPMVPNIAVQQIQDQANAQAAMQAALLQGKVGQLPPGWEEYVSEEHGGRVYYTYSQTGDASWERPVLMADGSTQFFPTEEAPLSPSQIPGKDLPDLRGKGAKLGSLKKSFQAVHKINKKPDAEASTPGGSTLRTEAQHRTSPPPAFLMSAPAPATYGRHDDLRLEEVEEEQDDGEEDERPAAELDQQVPAFRRLPLMRPEATHGAPVPEIPLDGLGDDDAELDSVRGAVNRSMEAAANSQEVILPTGWELHTTSDGREFYVNLRAGVTQWDAPKLPPHWEERFSREGKVYYLSLFDGRTQWDWPQENPVAFEHRLEELRPEERGSNRLALALPGSTQEIMRPLEDDAQSVPSTDTSDSDGAAMDQVDADQLLAIPPGGEGQAITPREDDRPEKESVKKWGIDERDKEWLALKREMQAQKEAHNNRYRTALQFPGVREFVRPYELTNQTNNWDKALDNVTLKIDNIERNRHELGDVAELRKEELRNIFPVCQRLQWTKNPSWLIVLHCVMRELPIMRAYFNVVRPPKTHRVVMHIFRVVLTMLGATACLSEPATVNEQIDATSRATWSLFEEAISMPLTGNTVLFALVGHFAGVLVLALIRRIFYAYQIPYNAQPTTSTEARRYQLRYWHELAEMGKWTCLVGMFMGIIAVSSLCVLMPQPRAGAVFQAFWLALFLGHWVLPLMVGIGSAIVLITARKQATFDGLLTVFPNFMDFSYIGVKTTEFLSWRAQRIIAEEELLLQVYPDLPKIGRQVREADDEDYMPPPMDPSAHNAIQDH